MAARMVAPLVAYSDARKAVTMVGWKAVRWVDLLVVELVGCLAGSMVGRLVDR